MVSRIKNLAEVARRATVAATLVGDCIGLLVFVMKTLLFQGHWPESPSWDDHLRPMYGVGGEGPNEVTDSQPVW